MSKTYQVYEVDQGEGTVLVDEDLKATLNSLARIFYRCHGGIVEFDYDFSNANHPQEKLMFQLALEAYYFELNYGLE